MAQVFISYAKADRPDAGRLAEFLQEQGFSVWWDRELVGGDQFATVIAEELARCTAVIVIWTESSINSDWVLDEADTARKAKKLIPVRADALDVEQLPLSFRRLEAIPLSDRDGIAKAVARFCAEPHEKLSLWAIFKMRLARWLTAARRRLTLGNLAITVLAVGLIAGGLYLSFAFLDWRRVKGSLQPNDFVEHITKYRYSPTAWWAQSKLDGKGAWQIIQATREKQNLQDFIKAHKNSIYFAFARLRLARLEDFDNGQYKPVLPDSPQRAYTEEEIAQLFPRTDPQACKRLWQARNEIYYRLGYCFGSEKGQKVFNTRADCPYADSKRIKTYNSWVDDILSGSTVEFDNFTLLRRLRCETED
jgi:hypothetical protein